MEGSIEEAEFEADQEEDEALKKEKAAEVSSRKAKLDELYASGKPPWYVWKNDRVDHAR